MATLTEEIAIKLGINTSTFNTALKEADATLKATKKAAEDSAGGIASLDQQFSKMVQTLQLAAVVGFAKSILQNADALDQMAENLGVNVEVLQAFQAEVRASNGTNEDATKILTTVRLKLDELRAGNQGAEESFAMLGLKVRDFQGLSLEQSLERIARAYVENSDRAGAYAALQDLVGKGGRNLMDVLIMVGKDGLDPLTAKWKEAGAVIDDVSNKSLAEANKKFEQMTATASTWAAKGFAAFAGAVEFVAQGVAGIANAIEGLPPAWDEVNEATKKTTESTKAEAAAVGEVRGALVLTKEQKKELNDLERQAERDRKAADKEQADAAKATLDYQMKIYELKQKLLTPAERLAKLTAEESTLRLHILNGIDDEEIARASNVRLAQVQVELQGVLADETKRTADEEKKATEAKLKTVEATIKQQKALENLYRSSLQKTGDSRDLTDVQISALLAKVQAQLNEVVREDQLISNGTPGNIYKSPVQYQLAQELAQIKAEMELRREFERDVSFFGAKYAEQKYAPSEFDRLMQLMNPDLAKQQASDIKTITKILGQLIGTPGAGGYYAGYNAQGVFTISSTGRSGTFSAGDPNG